MATGRGAPVHDLEIPGHRNANGLAQPGLLLADRPNAVTQVIGYRGAGVAPHAATTRATYTVPAGKRARLVHVYAYQVSLTAGSAAGLCRTTVQLNADSTMVDILTAARVNLSADVPTQVFGVATHIDLVAGESLNIVTENLNTGGTVGHWASAVLVEFDA